MKYESPIFCNWKISDPSGRFWQVMHGLWYLINLALSADRGAHYLDREASADLRSFPPPLLWSKRKGIVSPTSQWKWQSWQGFAETFNEDYKKFCYFNRINFHEIKFRHFRKMKTRENVWDCWLAKLNPRKIFNITFWVEKPVKTLQLCPKIAIFSRFQAHSRN